MKVNRKTGIIGLSERETDSWFAPTPKFDVRELCAMFALRVLATRPIEQVPIVLVRASVKRGGFILRTYTRLEP